MAQKVTGIIKLQINAAKAHTGKLNLRAKSKMQDCMQKSIFSDSAHYRPLDVVDLIENGKNKRSDKSGVNITMLT